MEYLRWILLAGGAVFVMLIYVLGKRRSSTNDFEEDLDTGDLPSFSARDWDELDEGVGEVRIIARTDDNDLPNVDKSSSQRGQTDKVLATESSTTVSQAEAVAQEHKTDNVPASEVIVLYILAQPDEKLSGDRVNSAVRANGMVFGEMNIFHRLDERGKPVYSLANMLEPGAFDPVTMHEMQTPGVILFMQLPGPASPLACFNHMLQSASRIADMLGAQLSNNRRQPLNEVDTESLRKKVAVFDA
jgi:cell division protein ZipA